LALFGAINYGRHVNFISVLDRCSIFTIVHGVQRALVAGDTDFAPQRLSDGAIVACLPREGVNSL
jgi:hypothetical protein